MSETIEIRNRTLVRTLTSQKRPERSECVKTTKIGTHIYFYFLFDIALGVPASGPPCSETRITPQ